MLFELLGQYSKLNSVIILLQIGCSAPVRTPGAAPSVELPCAQRSGFQGFPVTVGRDDQLDSVFEKGWGEEWMGGRVYANLQISSKTRLHFRNVGSEKKKRDCFAAKGSLPLYSGNYRLPLC